MSCTLILGGARSGKSTLAQEMARKATGDVLFVATAEAGDEDMRARIEAHQRSRPAHWKTLEAPLALGPRLRESIGGATTVIVDCVTLLVNNIFQENGWTENADRLEKAVRDEIDGLIACMDSSGAHFIIVSNEVGLGIVPADRISRLYRDVLGRANQMLAARADEVYLLVAGIPLVLKKAD